MDVKASLTSPNWITGVDGDAINKAVADFDALMAEARALVGLWNQIGANILIVSERMIGK